MDNSGGYSDLAVRLKALAFPTRLALLRLLRTPRRLADIKVRPVRRDGGLDPSRFVARQTVERHLKSLLEMRFVVAEDGPEGRFYRASPEATFLLREDLNDLCAVFAGAQSADDETLVLASPRPPAPQGPHLVLVKGAYEGQRFPLARKASEWTIGRHGGAEVSLSYDPYVSKRHARILRVRGSYYLRNDSRNGSLVNWSPVAVGAQTALSPGAVISVGRSMLVFTKR